MQSSIAVIVATMEVPFAAVVAFLAFGDRLGKWQVVGGILVILGIALLSIPQKRRITAVNQQRAKGI
jgi:drug/metabolite transporter (DMT)-like permease